MLRKNIASQYVYFGLIKAADGTALTGATVTGYRSLDTAAQAGVTGTFTELGNGQYRFNPSQADTNGDYVGYFFAATSAVPVNANFITTGGNFANAASFGMTNLDTTISSRSTYAGGAVASVTGAVGSVTSGVTVTTNNDKTGYSVSTVSDKTGYALTSAYDPAKTAAQAGNAMTLTGAYDAAKTAAQAGNAMALTSAYDAAKTAAQAGDTMKLDLTQAVPTSNTAQTVGDSLNAARAQGFGKWVLSGTTLTLYAANGTTVVRTFTLDSASAPTSRA